MVRLVVIVEGMDVEAMDVEAIVLGIASTS